MFLATGPLHQCLSLEDSDRYLLYVHVRGYPRTCVCVWVLEVGNGSPYQNFSSPPHGGDLGLKIALKIFFVQLEW